MLTASAGASSTARPFHLITRHIVNWAEAQPAHQELQAEVKRLKRERDNGIR